MLLGLPQMPRYPISAHPRGFMNQGGGGVTWSDQMLTSYLTINNHADYSNADKANILSHLEEEYVVNTFGPDGLNKTVCDFFISIGIKTEAKGGSTISKSGETLRWNYGNGDIYTQNNLPTNISEAFISFTSLDGFAGLTRFSPPAATFKFQLFNVPYYFTNCSLCQIIGSSTPGDFKLTGDISDWVWNADNENIQIYGHELTGDPVNWTFPVNVRSFNFSICKLEGTIPNFDPSRVSPGNSNMDFSKNKISKQLITNFITDQNQTFDFSDMYFDQTEIANFISSALTYYTANTPGAHFALIIDGPYNSTIVDGESNADLIALKDLFTTAGFTCTVTYNDPTYLITSLSKGAISIHSDDGYMTDYTKLLPLFESINKKWTSFVYDQFLGGAHMEKAEIDELISKGIDIQLHKALIGQTETEMRTAMDDAVTFWATQGWPAFEHIAYTGGSYDATVLLVVADYCDTGRTVGSVATANTANRGWLMYKDDPNYYALRSMHLNWAEPDIVNLCKGKIDDARIKKAAASFYVHEVTDANIEVLREILQYAIDTGVDIITHDETHDLLVEV